mgnify:FL=1
MTKITNREYAEALYELGQSQDMEAEVSDALDLLERVLAENPGYLDTLASPAISRSARMQAIESALAERVPRAVVELVRLMVSRGHAGNVPGMMAAYRNLARERRGESIALVSSAVELTPEEKEALRVRLEKQFSRKMILRCTVDPALLGGVRVETEGRVLDGSVRARLQKIKEVMDS